VLRCNPHFSQYVEDESDDKETPTLQFRIQVSSGTGSGQGQRTISELSSEYSVHPNQVSQWKRQLLEGGADLFDQNGNKEQREQQAVQTDLYEQIGRLKMELEWLKKSYFFHLTRNALWLSRHTGF
jgi:transposase